MRIARIQGQGFQRARRMISAASTVLLFAVALLPAASRAAEERAVRQKVPPVYPEIAKRMRVEGTVKLEATVDSAGKVKDVKTVSGHHLLAEAAEQAVWKWKFEPGDGDAKVDLSVNFTLNQ